MPTLNKISIDNVVYDIGNSSEDLVTDSVLHETLEGYLSKTNTIEYTPSADYHPATKKYVDDNLPVFFIEDTFSLNNPFILEGKKPGIYNIFKTDSSKKATMLYIKGATSNTTTLQYGLYGAFVIVRDYKSAPTGSVVAMYMAENLSYYGISKTSTNNSGLMLGSTINNYSKLITSHGDSEITGLYKFTSEIPQITSTVSPSLDQHIVTKKYVDDSVNKNIYSLDEVLIGTYLGKPLYRKMYKLEGSSYYTFKVGDIEIVNISGYVEHENKMEYFRTYVYQNGFTVSVSTQYKEIYVSLGQFQATGSGYLVIEYTKITN